MTAGSDGRRRAPSFDATWDRYLASYHTGHPGITERILARARHATAGSPYSWLRAAIPPDPGAVVDVACGSAPLHPLLPDAVSYLGIDRSRAELSYAAGQGRGPLVTADALSLPLPSGSVDVVACSMAVMLLQPIDAALAEVARVLRPGGRFVTMRPVGTPFRPADLRVAGTLVASLRHTPEMPQRFSGSGLRARLQRAGLRVTSDEALRFVHPLESAADAGCAVEALYLPHVGDDRRRTAAVALARIARPGRELPIPLRRTVARRG